MSYLLKRRVTPGQDFSGSINRAIAGPKRDELFIRNKKEKTSSRLLHEIPFKWILLQFY